MQIYNKLSILDLTRIFSGPIATRHFADLGANVIKIEPIHGDDTRNFPPIVGDWSGYFEILNRNKSSLLLNLKTKEGLDKFYELCKTADIIVENFSPSVKAKLKIDYSTIKKLNPKIIYASLSGISKDNPRKYYDIVAQAESGLISLNNGYVNRTAIVDAFAGMKLAFGISSALFYREKSGIGLEVNISMLGCAMDLLEQNLVESGLTNQNPNTEFDTAICPFGVFKTLTQDIAIGIGNESIWKNFSALVLELDSKFDFRKYNSNKIRLQNSALITQEIQKNFLYKTAQELQNLFEQNGIPSGIVSTMQDILNNKSSYDNNLIQKVYIPNVGEVVVPVGGIQFGKSIINQYKPAPKLNDYGI
jgi:CoA:oxalate CoA-transferase